MQTIQKSYTEIKKERTKVVKKALLRPSGTPYAIFDEKIRADGLSAQYPDSTVERVRVRVDRITAS